MRGRPSNREKAIARAANAAAEAARARTTREPACATPRKRASSPRNWRPGPPFNWAIGAFFRARRRLRKRWAPVWESLSEAMRTQMAKVRGYTPPPFDDPLTGAVYEHDEEQQLRRVRPYYWHYITSGKQRWDGRTLVDVFTTEFRDRPPEFYHKAVGSGKMLVNGVPSTLDVVVHTSDVIEHWAHKHEPPVSLEPIRIVHRNDSLLVVNKPAGIPVHPTGRYRHNSILHILRMEHEGLRHERELAPCNRLDRLTSGLMFFAFNGRAANAFREQLLNKTVQKEYIAKVIGEFPEGEVVCEEPLLTSNPKLGLNRVSPAGKQSRSVFYRLMTTGEHSIVLCRPLTGRTHQLRVHLQWLGHPIANDPLYANKRVWGPELGRAGAQTDFSAVEAKLALIGKTATGETVPIAAEPPPTEDVGSEGQVRTTRGGYVTGETVAEAAERRDKRIGELLTGQVCEECGTPLYSDPAPSELGIYLHAWRYWNDPSKATDTKSTASRMTREEVTAAAVAAEDWHYETSLPSWALAMGLHVTQGRNGEITHAESVR